MSFPQTLLLTSSRQSRLEEAAHPLRMRRGWSTEAVPWTKASISPCKRTAHPCRQYRALTEETPANRRFRSAADDRFTRERSLVQAQRCPSERRRILACSLAQSARALREGSRCDLAYVDPDEHGLAPRVVVRPAWKDPPLFWYHEAGKVVVVVPVVG